VTYFLKPFFEHKVVPVLGPSFGNKFGGCFHVSRALEHSLQKALAPSRLKARFWDNLFGKGSREQLFEEAVGSSSRAWPEHFFEQVVAETFPKQFDPEPSSQPTRPERFFKQYSTPD
jgi:hypothetical protein